MAGLPAESSVDRLYGEFSALLAVLDKRGDLSLRNAAEETFQKTLILASASYLERCLTKSVEEFVARVTAEDHVVRWFVQKKAIDRQYHTWFDWKTRNANQFFNLFGGPFSEHARALVREDEELSTSIAAFMEIGRERNRLVHQDFASLGLEKTSTEVYDLYGAAAQFVAWVPSRLEEFESQRELDRSVDSSATA